MAFRTPGLDGKLGEETQTNILRARKADLFNTSLESVPCTIDEMLVVPERGGDGLRMFRGHGRKVAKTADLPPAFLSESEKQFPGVTTQVISWE
jgi:hypothetical protein